MSPSRASETPSSAAQEKLEELDLYILSDMTTSDELDDWVPCYYVGWPSDYSAGIRGGSVSPTFASVEEAEQWVLDELKKEMI